MEEGLARVRKGILLFPMIEYNGIDIKRFFSTRRTEIGLEYILLWQGFTIRFASESVNGTLQIPFLLVTWTPVLLLVPRDIQPSKNQGCCWGTKVYNV